MINKDKAEMMSLQELLTLLSEKMMEEDSPEGELPTSDMESVTVKGDSPEAVKEGLDMAEDLVGEEPDSEDLTENEDYSATSEDSEPVTDDLTDDEEDDDEIMKKLGNLMRM